MDDLHGLEATQPEPECRKTIYSNAKEAPFQLDFGMSDTLPLTVCPKLVCGRNSLNSVKLDCWTSVSYIEAPIYLNSATSRPVLQDSHRLIDDSTD